MHTTPQDGAIVPQLGTEFVVNIGVLAIIAAGVRREQPIDPTNALTRGLHNALDKAIEQLETGIAFTLRGDDTLEVDSSRPGHPKHLCSIHTCDCEAFANGRFCWHRALCLLLISYNTMQVALTVALAVELPQPARPARPPRAPRRAPELPWTPSGRSQTDADFAETCRLADALYA